MSGQIAEARAAIEAFVAGHRQDGIDALAALVAVPSDNPPGDCVAHAERAAAWLTGLGLTVERHPVPAALVRENGMIAATNLVVRESFGRGPVIALNAHGDVVPPGEGWTADPYGGEIRDGWMMGRGAATSKSDFVTYAHALLALKAAGVALKGGVELHFTYDEETGGAIGPEWLLEQGITRPDYAICAGFSYGVVSAHNGCLHLEVEVRGASAHAAAPHTGSDALEATTAVMADLYRARDSYAERVSAIAGITHPTLVIGLISGGINTNVVPDRVVFRVDRRLIPEENAAEVEADLNACIAAAAARFDGIEHAIRRVLLAHPLVPVAGSETLVAALTRCANTVLGEVIESHGLPIYTDARHYSAAGVPTVLYGAGPRTMLEANAHRADERLKLDDLEKATKVVAFTLLELLRDGS
jgi:succinyl-diaminopimelate desuccinylase